MSRKKAYNLICKHKIAGLIPDAIKYRNVNEHLLQSKIDYLCGNYNVEVIFIYNAEDKSLAGWFRTSPPKVGLTWKHQSPGQNTFTNH